MPYDYIVKLETLESDNLRLNNLLKTMSNATDRKSHVNRKASQSDPYKYDEILRDFEFKYSTLFKQVLNK